MIDYDRIDEHDARVAAELAAAEEALAVSSAIVLIQEEARRNRIAKLVHDTRHAAGTEDHNHPDPINYIPGLPTIPMHGGYLLTELDRGGHPEEDEDVDDDDFDDGDFDDEEVD